MMIRLALAGLILAALLLLTGSVHSDESGIVSQERVAVCPGALGPWGWRVMRRNGRVLIYCQDGVYTPEQVVTGQTWDEIGR